MVLMYGPSVTSSLHTCGRILIGVGHERLGFLLSEDACMFDAAFDSLSEN